MKISIRRRYGDTAFGKVFRSMENCLNFNIENIFPSQQRSAPMNVWISSYLIRGSIISDIMFVYN